MGEETDSLRIVCYDDRNGQFIILETYVGSNKWRQYENLLDNVASTLKFTD